MQLVLAGFGQADTVRHFFEAIEDRDRKRVAVAADLSLVHRYGIGTAAAAPAVARRVHDYTNDSIHRTRNGAARGAGLARSADGERYEVRSIG